MLSRSKTLCLNPVSGTETSDTQEDIYVASVETDRGVREQLRLYDTRGLHEGLDLPKHFFSVADGFVLVYSVDSLESFKKVELLKKEIDRSRDKKEACISTNIDNDKVTVFKLYGSVTINHIMQWSQTQVLECHSSAEFISSQLIPAWTF